ncbi:glucose--fructose oxidoreductase precursor [bacterium BMS3Abin02]|nr:glucose--fructose oxidoreductase precursor [bacterium BMS3Abin02]GBE21794.1 glucose--fructose oxidoreductase precursor [bacterium BMS3Bbin01]
MSGSYPSVRWGVLGTGSIAQGRVIPALQGAERCDLVAIASRSSARANGVAARLGIPRAYGSYEELLADPEVDAVYLPLPNDLHGAWTKKAADAGKHVLCEKPIALTSDEAQEVAARCADRNVLVMEAFMYRFHPAWIAVRELVADGSIGRITDVGIWFSFRSTRAGDYRLDLEAGGGALYDVGCYAVDVSRMLLGDDPLRVQGAARVHPEWRVDMTFSGILDYGDAFATFTCSIEQEPEHRVMIHGTDGWISIADPFNCPPDVATKVTIGTGGDHHPLASIIETLTIPPANQYGLQATALADAIINGGPSPLPIEGSVANMRLLERLFAAAGIEPPKPRSDT